MVSKSPAVPPKRQGEFKNHPPVQKKPAQTRPAHTHPAPAPVQKTANKAVNLSGAGRVAKKVTKKAYTGSFDSKFAPRLKPEKSVVSYRHMIAAEFWVGLIVILVQKKDPETAMTSVQAKDNPLVQAAAFIVVFAILFAMSGGGRNAAKIAAALGGLIDLTLLLFNASFMNSDRPFGVIQTNEHNPKYGPPKGANVPGEANA